MGAAHGAALNVPARAAHAVGAFPCGLTGLCCLPDGKVGGVLLQVVLHAAAQLAVAALQIVQIQVAQLAVAGVALHPEVHIAVFGNVGVAGVDQILDDIENLGDVLGSAGLHSGLFAVQPGGILQVLGLKALCHLLHGSALLLALLDELIVDIGDVGNIDYLVAAVLEVAAQGGEHDQRAGVADVDIVINGRAADVDAVFTGHLRHEFFFLAGQRVENLHGCFSFTVIFIITVQCREVKKKRPFPALSAHRKRSSCQLEISRGNSALPAVLPPALPALPWAALRPAGGRGCPVSAT